jgi:hypothetical protein
MPCILQPGRLLLKMRVCYTTRRKLGLLASAKHIQEKTGLSLHQAAERLMVYHSLLVRLQKQ